MKSKILAIIMISCLIACTKSTTKNETAAITDTTQTAVFKPVDFEEQLIYS